MAQTATGESERKPVVRVRVLRGVIRAILLLAGLCLVFRPWHSKPPQIVLLPPTTTIKHDPFPDRLIPRSWGWAWRLRDSIMGKRTPVTFEAQMFRVRDAALLADLGHLPAATLVTNGLSMWRVANVALESTRALLQDQNKLDPVRARLNTADGIVATMFSGFHVQLAGNMTPVGFTLQVLPRTHTSKTDVTLSVKWTEMLHRSSGAAAGTRNLATLETNFMQVARVQIPIGNGFLLIQSPSEMTPGVVFLLSTGR